MPGYRDLYKKFTPGDKVIVDGGRLTQEPKEVIKQTPEKMFTKIKNKEGSSWEVMTNRLTLYESANK